MGERMNTTTKPGALAVMDEAATYGARMPSYLAPDLREARATVERLAEALRRADEMLRIAGPLVGEFAREEVRHYDGADCDGTCIEEDCRDAADSATDALAAFRGEA